jgi:hypothetical protein
MLGGCAHPPPAPTRLAALPPPPPSAAPVVVPRPPPVPLPPRKPMPPPELAAPPAEPGGAPAPLETAGAQASPGPRAPPPDETMALAGPPPATSNPVPPYPAQSSELIGLDQAAAVRLFGNATVKTEKPPATVWKWRSPSCGLDLYFYLDLRSGRLRSLHYVFHGDSSGQQDCLKSLAVAARG